MPLNSPQSNNTSKLIVIILATISVSSCATRPLIQNVTRYNSYEIAQRIRCEFRDGIKSQVLKALKASNQNELHRKLKNQSRSYSDFFEHDLKKIDPQAAELIEKFALSFIAYEFDFNITEENKLSGGADFLDILTLGQLKLGITANADRKRQNVRNFKSIDNFKDLITHSLMDTVCSKKYAKAKQGDLIYPISGSLNLVEVIDTFLSLNLSGNLVGNVKDLENVPTLSDTMTFTTTLTNSVNPTITLTPVGRAFQLTGANLNTTNSRTDVHKLTIAMTLPEDGYKKTGKPFALKRARFNSKKAALAELERQRIRAIDSNTELIRTNLLGP